IVRTLHADVGIAGETYAHTAEGERCAHPVRTASGVFYQKPRFARSVRHFPTGESRRCQRRNQACKSYASSVDKPHSLANDGSLLGARGSLERSRTMTGWIDADPIAALVAVAALCVLAGALLWRERRGGRGRP